ncbi:hypothetical protein QJS10_CPB17g00832 [Acorus calamus]|uniref:Reverse transcriptase zinc-binding domain-containing protein n=1 Tax=Acorus calamus TaxID=4465 RepID=A0AAV9CWZ0_ACOCL|nr:hypothetical protein QJS10_CPB17g00832 [Acorus calamus]
MRSAMNRFSEWIDEEGLLDLPLANHAYTWSNMRADPTLVRLDRVLICPDWEERFPLCSASGLPRTTSDHCPILLRSLDPTVKRSPFRFENWWLEHNDLQMWEMASSEGHWNLNLRRISTEDQVAEVARMLEVLHPTAPGRAEDKLYWGGNKSEIYSVKSGYRWWMRNSPGITTMFIKTPTIWKWKIPLKVKIFLWLALQQRILTKTYRAKWRPEEDTTCVMCHNDPETTEHLLCTCLAMALVWRRVAVMSSSQCAFSNLEELWERLSKCPSLGASGAHARVAQQNIPVMIWATWLERNGVIFKGQRFHVENVWESMMALLRDWGVTLAGASSVGMDEATFVVIA